MTVVLYSSSGYGKSSLINAGVLPRFAEGGDVDYYTVRFGAYQEGKSLSPVENVRKTIGEIEDDTFLNRIIPNDNTLWRQLKSSQLTQTVTPKSVLLIFDQFEELFFYPETEIFLLKKQLADLINTTVPALYRKALEARQKRNPDILTNDELKQLNQPIDVRILIAIRADRISQMNQFTDYLPQLMRNMYELKPLDKAQATDALQKPAQLAGSFHSQPFTFTQAAIDLIVNHLTKSNTQPIETTQLQIVANRCEGIIHQLQAGSTKLQITPDRLPDFEHIFLDFYLGAIDRLPETEQGKTREFIEEELIKREQRISVDRLTCFETLEENTLNTLVDIHLLRSERNTVGGISYEISHDTLVSPIMEAAKERHAQLEEAAADRERQEEMRIAKAKAAAELQKTKEKAETERIERERERKQQRKIITIVSVAAVIAIVLAVFGIVMWQQAEQQKEIAKQEQQKAKEQQAKAEAKEKEVQNMLSQLKASEFQRLTGEADKMILSEQFYEASEKLKESIKFSTDSAKIQYRIDSLIAKAGKAMEFHQLIKQGDALFTATCKDAAVVRARSAYSKALRLNYDNSLANIKLKAIKLEINKRITQYITNMKSITSTTVDKELIMSSFINPGLKLDPSNAKLLRLKREYQ